MTTIVLTGGIGTGKSTVSRQLAQHGAVVVDYDLLAREAVEPGSPGLSAIVERFGDGVLSPDGTLDRPALGSIVFADEAARRDLEAITHPAVRDLAVQQVLAAGPDAVVVHDIPLFVESGAAPPHDLVVVVDVPESVQVERLVRDRGMTEDEAHARIAAQASQEQRLAVADVVLDNAGTPDELIAAVDALWTRLTTSAS
ncbi:dephospho-CoA kinase [Aeromicrobium sp. Root495]|uniref:dephospho-CoA kinase n=1 Tax=Aeromicrobium sp. Root495 TaxID=1736550 RepID=UPI0006FF2665|nr:dephospho-CoA kinase [Aeromicrobium sp. Root495]KQY59091.1 dephospho-CoA kinase [Aeromicrobium sp. Root495]